MQILATNLWFMGTHYISVIFTKEYNFYGFLFVSPQKSLFKGGQGRGEVGGFLLRQAKLKMTELFPLKVYPFVVSILCML